MYAFVAIRKVIKHYVIAFSHPLPCFLMTNMPGPENNRSDYPWKAAPQSKAGEPCNHAVFGKAPPNVAPRGVAKAQPP